jgi:hypothetical protein
VHRRRRRRDESRRAGARRGHRRRTPHTTRRRSSFLLPLKPKAALFWGRVWSVLEYLSIDYTHPTGLYRKRDDDDDDSNLDTRHKAREYARGKKKKDGWIMRVLLLLAWFLRRFSPNQKHHHALRCGVLVFESSACKKEDVYRFVPSQSKA